MKRTLRYGAWAGAIVGVALAGVLYLLMQLRLTSFVPLDIANLVIEWTPGKVATTTIETLGTWGKRLLMAGSVVGFVLAYVVLGAILSRLLRDRSRRIWLLIGALSGGLPLAVTLFIQRTVPASRAVAPPWSREIPVLLAVFIVAGMALGWLAYRLIQVPAAATETPVDDGRRRFLLTSTGAALALAFGSTALAALLPRREIAGAGKALPTGVAQLPTIAPPSTAILPSAVTATAAPAGATAAPPQAIAPSPTALPTFMPATGTRPEITEQSSLYIISSATTDPEVDVAAWRLKIHGLVDTPYELSYDELLALPRHDQTSTLECISNEVGNLLIGNCNWNGVRLRDLLERAGVQSGVIDVVFRAAEGYSESLPLDRALNTDTLIAYGVDGQALEVRHGFPARVRVAGLYGEKNVKWLTEIELVAVDYKGYWQQRGWTDDATIYTTAVIDTGNPRLGGTTLTSSNGTVMLGGIGFAGERGIRSVELQIDNGEWRPVQLKESSNDLSWRLWRYEWTDATPGKHTLTVRAVDGTGQPQVAEEQDTHPDGATGYHSVKVTVQ